MIIEPPRTRKALGRFWGCALLVILRSLREGSMTEEVFLPGRTHLGFNTGEFRHELATSRASK
jgi:hypothetical protein